MNKLLWGILLCIYFMPGQMNGQSYNSAMGIKAGNMLMMSYKRFINYEVALELSAGYYLVDYPGTFVNLVAEYHVPTNFKDLNWYYGGGVGTRIYRIQNQIGFAGAIGLDVSSQDFPINLSIGFQPVIFIEFESLEYYLTGPVTVSIRAILR